MPINYCNNKPKKDTIQHTYTATTSLESTTLDIRGRKPEEIDFEVITEDYSSYRLDDETVLKVKIVLIKLFFT